MTQTLPRPYGDASSSASHWTKCPPSPYKEGEDRKERGSLCTQGHTSHSRVNLSVFFPRDCTCVSSIVNFNQSLT
jgi:hypothetical protein